MKITIEPSTPGEGYIAVTMDTLSNEESSTEAAALALSALVAYGHSSCNVARGAQQWVAEEVSRIKLDAEFVTKEPTDE